MKRSSINRVSKKRKAQNAIRKILLADKYGPPAYWKCEIGPIIGDACFGPVNGHELLKRSRGGSITDLDNIMLACNYHNEWVESHPQEAHEMGLAIHSWERNNNAIEEGQ